jgi:hypothetical protein
MRVVGKLDVVLIFTPYDEANYLLCSAIFDQLPRYQRPRAFMSIADPCWDDQLNALSPTPVQIVPTIAVAQFLSNALASEALGRGSLIDLTSNGELGAAGNPGRRRGTLSPPPPVAVEPSNALGPSPTADASALSRSKRRYGSGTLAGWLSAGGGARSPPTLPSADAAASSQAVGSPAPESPSSSPPTSRPVTPEPQRSVARAERGVVSRVPS